MNEPDLPRELAELSLDAKMVGSSWFSMMKVGPNSEGVVFHMQESKPADWAVTALEEMIKAGIIEKYDFNKFGSIGYRPLISFWPLFGWTMWAIEKSGMDKAPFKRSLVEPINEGSETQGEIKIGLG